EKSNYTVTVTLKHDAAADATVTSNVSVADPDVKATAMTINAVEGSAFSGATATFTDPGGAEPNAADSGVIADHYSATIDWGDGSALDTGVITYDAGTGKFTVSGSHTYAEEGNTYKAVTTIYHENSNKQSVTSTVVVSDPSVLGLGVNVSAVEGQA